MSIQQDVLELQSLDTEMKQLRKQLKELNLQKTSCEQRIIEYLQANDQPGLKMNGMTIIAQPHRKLQQKNARLERTESILRKYGVKNSKETLNEIMTALRSTEEDERPKLKLC